MSYNCSYRRKLLFVQFKIRFNVVFMSKIGIKYQYLSRVVCAYTETFRNDQGVRLLEHVR